MGARLDRAGTELRDFQTARLAASDKGWTTRGEPEGRAGGASTYRSPHIRKRHYRSDAFVTVVLRLEPPDDDPTLQAVASALSSPARPLFIGRKPCLPSRPVAVEPFVDAANVYDALQCVSAPPAPPRPAWRQDEPDRLRLLLPPGEWPRDRDFQADTIADLRDWRAGVHAGESRLDEIWIERAAFPRLDEEALP